MTKAYDALVLIDLQNDYFPGGAWELPGAQAAGDKAAKLLKASRNAGIPVIHVRHESTPDRPLLVAGSAGAEFAPRTTPESTEAVVVKTRTSAFMGTTMDATLAGLGGKRLLVAGMMSNNCVDHFVRTTLDMGYAVTVAHDACAAMAVEFDGVRVSAEQVHAAFMLPLAMNMARMATTEELLDELG